MGRNCQYESDSKRSWGDEGTTARAAREMTETLGFESSPQPNLHRFERGWMGWTTGMTNDAIPTRGCGRMGTYFFPITPPTAIDAFWGNTRGPAQGHWHCSLTTNQEEHMADLYGAITDDAVNRIINFLHARAPYLYH